MNKQQLMASNCTAWVYNLKTSKNKCRNTQRKCSIKKAVLKNFAIFTEKHLCWSLFLIKLQKSVNGCLVHNMSLKTLKLEQGATEMFIFQNSRIKSLWNVMSELYKKCEVSKDCLNYLRWVVINSNFSYYLFFSFFVTRDSISLISKEFHSLETYLETNRTITFFAKTLHHRCSIRLCSQLYFPSEKEVNGKINSLRTLYSNELKKFSDSQKSGAGLDDTYKPKLVCFKLIWSCKYRIWCYHFWFRKRFKLIWSNKFDRVLAALKMQKQPPELFYKKGCS